MAAFLGVDASISGRRWVGPDIEQDRFALGLAQETGLPEALCRILAVRGITADHSAAYLSPTLRDLMPDPSTLKDMDKAANRLWQAVNQKQKVAIFADYDVDGGASAALLISWLRDLGMAATLYIPDRIDEGYGPNDAAMKALAKDHDLIICVDCGTLSHGPIAAASPVDVLVLDHHLAGETLPAAYAVVNPNRQDETTDLGYLCAAGVVFMLLVAVNRVMREAGKSGPDLMALLDLVALATVADVAPLRGLNRAFVQQGLKVMAARNRVGLVALGDVARMDGAPNSYHLGFMLGPRVNAGGRIGKADLGARLLATADKHEAEALAKRLEELNKDRRQIEEQVRLQAIEQAEERGFDGPLVWASGEGWHPGVVGIVASRLKEMANRPAIVIGFDGNDGKGSGRSVSGVDLGVCVQKLVSEGLLSKGGGHKMAAGLSIEKDKLPEAMKRLGELLGAQGSGNAGPRDLAVAGTLLPSAITVELIEQLEQAGPFGSGAPAPRFALPSVRVSFAKRAGESHLRLTFQDESGGRIDAIAFGAFDGPLGPMLQDHDGAMFHVAGRLEIDTWGGRKKAKMRLEDAYKISL